MRWVLLWAVLILGAAAMYVALALRLWRKVKAVARELDTTVARVETLESLTSFDVPER